LTDLIAAGIALGLTFYPSVTGNAGHLELQCALLLLGAVALFEHIVTLLDELLDRDR
jgi:hypothetical protein